MKHENIFNDFCNANGYAGTYVYNEITDEYHVVLSRGKDNAGAFLTPQEYKDMDESNMLDIIKMLDRGFKQKFK